MSPVGERAQRISRLTPLGDIFRMLDALAKPVAAREVDVDAAVGRTLAADVAARSPLPPKPVALRDGWAVQAELVADAGPYGPVPLSPAPSWVEAGGAMPPGTDAVLPPDAVTVNASNTEAVATVSPGEGVHVAEIDATAGLILRGAGERVRATDVAVLRAAGVAHVQVREPRVRVALANAVKQASDTVSPLVRRVVETEGAKAIFDRAMPLERALTDEADFVIGIGGTGMGRSDASVHALARLGCVALHGMGIAPGETAALGDVQGRPALLLPGRLDAALAVLLVVGHRMLARLSGAGEVEPKVPLTLKRKVVSQIGLAEVVPVRSVEGGIEPLASRTLPWRALTRADGWILVPPESEGFAAGATVEMRLLP
jgi:molybdopterin molybdotransferase